ncbi:hypothetical protein PE067_10480 [Paracoccus sp. DMF-8]|uniref:hypothetical protein n=1 Tax=Paracoccus sp. DMF-8 TaxID=3019445 RepID=UPI0023E7CFCB|nr:hypothetical protein [Paracoccus sp. DMF-8]MDF3606526.1 hypothetical protein [Paracoccus sp. DMF-8]
MTRLAVSQTDRQLAVRSLHELAKEALDRAGGDLRTATDSLNAALRDDEHLRLALIEPALEEMAAARAYKLVRANRTDILEASRKPLPNRAKVSPFAIVPSIRATLLDFPIAGGMKLRDACLEDVQKQSSIYLTQGTEMMRRGRWMAMIAAALPDADTPVGDVLAAEDLDRLEKDAADA